MERPSGWIEGIVDTMIAYYAGKPCLWATEEQANALLRDVAKLRDALAMLSSRLETLQIGESEEVKH